MAYTSATLTSNNALTLQGSGEVTWGMALSEVVSRINAVVKDDAKITKITLNFSGTAYNNGILYAYNEYAVIGLTNSDADAITNTSGGTGGTNLYKYGPFEIGNKKTVNLESKSIDITKYFNSYNPHSVQNTSYSRLTVAFSSKATYKKTYTFNASLGIEYEDVIYTITLDANGGKLNSSDTITRNSGETYGTVTTLEQAPTKPGYKFSYWSTDKEGAKRIYSTTSVTGNATLYAQYTAIEYAVKVECGASDSGDKCTITGEGTYKFGDTVTLQANVPAYHNFDGWLPPWASSYYDRVYSNPLTFTINEELADYENLSFYCYIEHTGFLLKANVSPEGSGVVEQGLAGTYESGEDYYFSEGILSAEGILVKYGSRNSYGIKAIANEDYKFVRWNDGNTSNPRHLTITGDVTYTAVFEVDKINNIFVGTSKPSKIYLGTSEVKEIYVGTTKVYG